MAGGEIGALREAAAALLQPMFSSVGSRAVADAEDPTLSRRRFFCTQCTSLVVTLLLCVGLGLYAVAKVEDFRLFLLAGCKMFNPPVEPSSRYCEHLANSTNAAVTML
jgi:hypothetical protein